MCNKLYFFTLSLLWLGFKSVWAEQPVCLPSTQQQLLSNKFKGITYKLYISLPQDYAKTPEKYDVVYVLDADYSFAIARNIVQHLSDRHKLPPLIIVGIAYGGPDAYKLNRTRDYTPVFVPEGGYGADYQKYSGGAPQFKQFLSEQLLPYMAQHYRVSHARTLVGHSFGGLFTTWVALTSPQLFTHYLAISPSLWYGDHYLFKLIDKLPSQASSLKLFFAIGAKENGGDYPMITDLKRFVRELRSKKAVGQLKLLILQDEDHDTVFPAALTRGLLAR